MGRLLGPGGKDLVTWDFTSRSLQREGTLKGQEEGNNGREGWGSFKGFSPLGQSFKISLFPQLPDPCLFRAGQSPQLDRLTFTFYRSGGHAIAPHLHPLFPPGPWTPHHHSPSYLHLLGPEGLLSPDKARGKATPSAPWWVSLGRVAGWGGESGWKTELGSFPA